MSIKINATTVKAGLSTIKRFGGKHTAVILTVAGIGCMAFAVADAIKSTPKAIELRDAKKEELQKDELTKVEAITVSSKAYIRTALGFSLGAACLIAANRISAAQIASLAAVAKLSEEKLDSFKQKTKDELGTERAQNLENDVNMDMAKKRAMVEQNIIYAGGDTLFYEPLSGRFFKSSKSNIKDSVNQLNKQMLYGEIITLNDWFDTLGLPHVDNTIGAYMFWTSERDLIEVRFDYPETTEDSSEPFFMLTYLTAPHYSYV